MITDTTPTEIKALPPTFFTSPQDRRSRRTTFNLSEQALLTKAWLSGYWRISQKDVLDHVAEVVFRFSKEEKIKVNRAVFEVFREMGGVDEDLSQVQRRTHVISQGALRVVEQWAEELDISRDEVLDTILILLGRNARDEAEEDLRRREEAEEMIRIFWEQAEDLESDLKELLGDDDPVVQRFSYACTEIMSLIFAIENEREKGTPINPDR